MSPSAFSPASTSPPPASTSLPILHHFEASPYSEKIRLLLGYLDREWASVLIPRIQPKPSLTALTGGYRKTPVLQLGRDLYCDTALIMRVIERLAEPDDPAPASLEPPAQSVSVRALETLGDRLFLAAIPVLFRPEGRVALVEQLGEDYLARFQADRAELFSGGSVSRPDAQFSAAMWEPTLSALDAQLTATPFLLGDAPTRADFSLYHPIWYVRANQGVAATLDAYPHLLAWFERLRAFGHGKRHEFDEPGARRIVGQSRDWQPLGDDHDPGCGFAEGERVGVHATDYGVDRIEGTLVRMSAETITLAREAVFEGEVLGPVRVHFPRRGFAVVSEASRHSPERSSG